MIRIILIVVLFLLFPRNALANQNVVINEIAAVTAGTSADPDWVEFYNSDNSNIDLTGWLLRDGSETNKVELNGLICPKSFRKFNFSNRLNKDGDTIRLLDNGGNPVDTVVYFSEQLPQHEQGQSTGRSPDGGSNWVVFQQPTPSDTDCQLPTPTPSPTPTPPPPTPSPKAATSPSPAPRRTPSPTPQITPSSAGKILATGTSLVLDEEESSLAATTEAVLAAFESRSAAPEKETKILPRIILILAGLSILAMVFSAFWLRKKR